MPRPDSLDPPIATGDRATGAPAAAPLHGMRPVAVGGRPYTAGILPLGAVAATDIDRWEALAAAAAEPNPFFEPSLVLDAEPVLGRGRSNAGLLVVVDGDRWVACLPVCHRTRFGRARVPPCLTSLCHTYCFLGTPLVAEDDVGGALTALVLAGTRQRTAMFVMDHLGAGGPVQAALETALIRLDVSALHRRPSVRAAVQRREDGDYSANWHRSQRKTLRRGRRGLEAALGGPVRLVDRSDDADAPGDFVRLEARGWKGAAGTAVASRPGHERWFRGACSALMSAGRLEVHELRAGDTAVAMNCNIVSGAHGISLKTAYDETYRKHSPGVVLEMLALDQFHAEGRLECMDSHTDSGNDMINHLWPHRRGLETICLPGGGALGRVTAPLVRRLAHRLERRVMSEG